MPHGQGDEHRFLVRARIGYPSETGEREIARGVLFLVADEGGFVTGSTLSINGGQHMY